MNQAQHKHTPRFWRKMSPTALKGVGIIAGAFLAGLGAYMATKTTSVVEKAVKTGTEEKSPLSATVVQLDSTGSVVNPREIKEGFVYMFDAPPYLQAVWNKTPQKAFNGFIQWGDTPTSISTEAWKKFAADTALHRTMAKQGIRDGQSLRLAIRNTSPNLIVIRSIDAVVLKKYPRGNAWFMNDDEFPGCGPGGEEMPVRTAVISLFHDPPKVEFFSNSKEWSIEWPSQVSIGLPPDDVLLLDVRVRPGYETVDWELDLLYLGRNGEGHLRVNENGKPFRVFDPAQGFHILHRELSRIVPYMPPC